MFDWAIPILIGKDSKRWFINTNLLRWQFVNCRWSKFNRGKNTRPIRHWLISFFKRTVVVEDRVHFYKQDENKVIEIITNNLEWSARTIAKKTKSFSTLVEKIRISLLYFLSLDYVLNSIKIFFDFLKREFNPIKWHRKLPLECEIDVQLYKGNADLVLETKEIYILTDYKSCSGSIDWVLNASSVGYPKSNYAGKHDIQLSTYQNIIETLTHKNELGNWFIM